ncbi:MAG: hypothetical protein HFF09_05245 [Oscillospiraceae bacterium]|nr:hypothetical protein [Oscillospiraceae bacterium]
MTELCGCDSTQEPSGGCIVCGASLRYHLKGEVHVCAVCGKEQRTHVECEAGHFVCDGCHTAGFEAVVAALRASNECDPMALFERMAEHSAIHLHGPEHHVLTPCILLAAYHNAGGKVDIEQALPEAVRRGREVSGGLCGEWGVCGAAAGVGIMPASCWARPR